jgi:hypothetical protein
VGNDYAFRCHNCGFAGNGVDLFWKSRRAILRWEEAILQLGEFSLFGDNPLDPQWVERGEAWSDFEPVFERARARMRAFENPLWNRQFGEVGVLPKEEFVERFKWAGKLSSFKKSKVYLRLVRTIHGLPSYVAIDERTPGMEFTRFYFNNPGPLEVVVPGWALFRDWSTELVAMTDMHTAVAYQNSIFNTETIGTHYAPMWIMNCTGPVHEEVPARIIHYIAGPGESGEFALALCTGRAEVKVSKISDRSGSCLFLPKLEDIKRQESPAIQFLVDMIVSGTESNSHAIAYLDSLLKKPWACPTTSAVITTALSRRLGGPIDELVRQMGSVESILPFEGESATYLSRNGLYLKTTDKLRTTFRPCSNFSLQIEESSTDGREVLGHLLQLRMGQMRTRFRIDDSDFQDGNTLMSKATLAALAANCPALPNLSSPSDVRLLPSIVRGTQSAPTSNLSVPAFWGFSPGRFQGPDFHSSSGGLRCYLGSNPLPACVSLLGHGVDGAAPGTEFQFLKFRANEFAAWFLRIPPEHRGAVAVLLYAAVFWLFRGSHGEESYLALPNPEYHLLFASLLGIRPIELGRARIEHPGVPRIMTACYSSTGQFGRQGRIVAALEAKDRRLDNRVISLLHRSYPVTAASIEAPFSLLPLLTHAIVSSRSIREAEETFLELIDDEYLRSEIRISLLKGRDFLVPPSGILDNFLKHVGELINLRDAIVSEDEKKGTVLLRTETVSELRTLGYHYDERRIADQLDTTCKGAAPIRNYGRSRIRVFQIPAERFPAEGEAEKSKAWVPLGF